MIHIFLISLITINLYGIDHPLKNCNKTTLLDTSSKIGEDKNTIDPRVRQVIETIHSQKSYGTC